MTDVPQVRLLSWTLVYIPTSLTVLRLLSPFYLVPLYLEGRTYWFGGVIVFVALTDWLDGALARRWRCTTYLGATLDIVADKMFCGVLIGIGLLTSHDWTVHISLEILLAYHVAVMLLRVTGKMTFAPSRVAKLKMFVEMSSLITAFGIPATLTPDWVNGVGNMGISFAAGLAIWSMLRYLQFVADWPLWLWPRRV